MGQSVPRRFAKVRNFYTRQRETRPKRAMLRPSLVRQRLRVGNEVTNVKYRSSGLSVVR